MRSITPSKFDDLLYSLDHLDCYYCYPNFSLLVFRSKDKKRRRNGKITLVVNKGLFT